MDMGFDHAAWPQPRDETADAPQALDWHGLRARFLAAQACRGEIGQERAAPGALGSFDAATAETLAGYAAGTPGINSIGLVDRKDDRATEQTTPGQRGPAIEGEND